MLFRRWGICLHGDRAGVNMFSPFASIPVVRGIPVQGLHGYTYKPHRGDLSHRKSKASYLADEQQQKLPQP